MEIWIDRAYCKESYTISRVFIDGKRFGDGKHYCSVIEDKDRGLKDTMSVEDIKKLKIYGQTAIPRGKYNVVRTYSPKFKKYLPLVENVKGYTGIRIHSGNTAQDSLGCILPGYNDRVGHVSDSRYWFGLLDKKIKEALDRKEKVTLKVG